VASRASIVLWSSLTNDGLLSNIETLMAEVFGLYYMISTLCAIAVAASVNFLASNFWVWRHSLKSSEVTYPRSTE
jgi:putative flippase GtrA